MENYLRKNTTSAERLRMIWEFERWERVGFLDEKSLLRKISDEFFGEMNNDFFRYQLGLYCYRVEYNTI